MKLTIALLAIVTLLGAIGAIGKVLWHTHGMFRGIRPSAYTRANLLPFLALSLPGTLDKTGQEHRAKMLLWLCVAVVLLLACFALQLVMGE